MDIPKVGQDNKKIAVIGGGKTGADAVVHLVRSGIKKENIVWVKKYDLAFGKREKPQDAFASAEQRAVRPSMPSTRHFAQQIREWCAEVLVAQRPWRLPSYRLYSLA